MLPCDCNDGTCQCQGLSINELSFLDAEIGEELRIFAQARRRLCRWFALLAIVQEENVRLKETSVTYKQVDEVIDGILEELPVDDS